jgi:hypothetical protein
MEIAIVIDFLWALAVDCSCCVVAAVAIKTRTINADEAQ